jgi:hypothetical protein
VPTADEHRFIRPQNVEEQTCRRGIPSRWPPSLGWTDLSRPEPGGRAPDDHRVLVVDVLAILLVGVLVEQR